MAIRLSEEEFAALVDQAIESLPEQFRARMENLSVEILPRPGRELLASLKMRLRDAKLLLGLYHGVPLTKKSVRAMLDWPERIYIFQRNVEAICETRGEAVRRVRETVLHEIGHHFGMTEEDLRRL